MSRQHVLEFFGVLFMGTCTLVFAALWWTAFVTGHSVRMTITQYDEAYLEAGIWFLIMPVMLFSLYSYLRRFPN